MNKEFIKRIISSIFLIPISLFFIIKGSYMFNIFLLICFLISAFEWHTMSKRNLHNIFGLFFLSFSFFTIFKLRNDFSADYTYVLFVLLICVSTDIGGYIFGRTLKGPKLTQISPKKTYAGVVGGYLLPMITVNFLLDNPFFYEDIELTFMTFIFVFGISTISQLGDITISYFKRLSNVKDTGKIIPGHGGLLDRIDGMIFAFPFSYIIFSANFLDIF
jgi:phosphatidate cytidylyltransferase